MLFEARRVLSFLRPFAPAPLAAGWRDLWLGSIGAGLGLLLTQWLAHSILGEANPWFLAPMGAAAVLVFCLPASPLAQPWPVFVGNFLAAGVGVTCQHWLGATPAAAALAAAGAIAAMFALRCLHPPAGAVALTAVLGGPAITNLGYGFAMVLVPANTVLLLLLGLLLNNLLGRRYPHVAAARPQPHATADRLPTGRAFLKQDLDAAMASYGEVLDVGVDDLEEILVRAQVHASRRRWGEVRCRDIMSRDVATVAPEASLHEAWRLLARHRVKALPVVDARGKLAGIVSLHDFFLSAAGELPRPTDAGRVHEIMTRSVRVARPERPMAELVEAFSDGGLHHMPVIDAEDRVVGMITQSDVVAALFLAQPGMPAVSEPVPRHARLLAARRAGQPT